MNRNDPRGRDEAPGEAPDTTLDEPPPRVEEPPRQPNDKSPYVVKEGKR